MRPTKAMVAAKISPLTIAILEGWSPKFVQSNRLALVLNGLECRRDLYAGWVTRGRESLAVWERKLAEAEHAHHRARADDQVRYYLASLRDYEGRLRAVTKSLAFIEALGLPGEVASYMPTCGPAVRPW